MTPQLQQAIELLRDELESGVAELLVDQALKETVAALRDEIDAP